MGVRGRVVIYETLDEQTILIAKAEISAVLNALRRAHRGEAFSSRPPLSADKCVASLMSRWINLAKQAWTYARDRNDIALQRLVQRVTTYPLSCTQASRYYKVVVINALRGADDVSRVDSLMTLFTDAGLVDGIGSDDVGAMLTVLVSQHVRAGMSTRNAVRADVFARCLGTTLSRRAYSTLLRQTTTIDSALPLLHRVVSAGFHPDVHALNHVLALCDGDEHADKARKVIIEMARRNVTPNSRTVQLLLQRADSVDAIDLVFDMLKRSISYKWMFNSRLHTQRTSGCVPAIPVQERVSVGSVAIHHWHPNVAVSRIRSDTPIRLCTR